MIRASLPLILALTFGLAGCLKRTNYERPTPPVPAQLPSNASTPSAGAAAAPADTPWKEFFTDTRLQQVIDLALANNRDLRTAALNVEKVHALYRIQRSQQFPTVGATADGNIYRMPENSGFAGLTPDGAIIVHQYSANIGVAAWELDLFGRVRNLKAAALEQYLASDQARKATQIALVAAVANTYLALAADHDSLHLAQETLAAQEASYDLIRQTRDAGLTSDLEVKQAQSQVESAKSNIVRYTGQIALDENALNLLVGAPVPRELLPQELTSAAAMKDISAGVSSEILLRRPDILMAEHQLRATYANIDVARAAFFPRITLTGGAGLSSVDLTKLFTPGSGAWSFAPQISLPLFDAGARKANLKVAQVDRDVAVSSYEKAIQSAFREVSDSLSQRATLADQEKAQQALVDTLQVTYTLSDARYKAGIDAYLSVLVAQRSLYAGQQVLVNVRYAYFANLVTLYKVLGGGA